MTCITKRSVILFMFVLALFSIACCSSANGSGCLPPATSVPTLTAGSSPLPVQAEPSATLLVVEVSPEPPAGCVNFAFPLVKDYQWIYRYDYPPSSDGSSSEPIRVSMTVSDTKGEEAEVSTLNLDTGIITQTQVNCKDGAILNFPTSNLNMILGFVNGDLQLEYVSGVFFPAEAEFVTADYDLKWTTELAATGTLTLRAEGETSTANLDQSKVSMEWQTAGKGDAAFEVVQTNAGSFPKALKVQRTTSIDIPNLNVTTGGETTNVSTTVKVYHWLWYAPGVGLVKQETEKATVMFFGVDFPVELGGVLQLVEYHTGQ